MAEPKVTRIVEFADPENHTTEPNITTLSYIQPKLWQIFWKKNPNFSLPWQQGSSEQSLVGASIWGVSPAQAEIYPILC